MTGVDEALETMSEAGEKIRALRQRNQDLRDALAGLIGLIVMVRHRDDVSPELRDVLRLNHRISEAHATLHKQDEDPL
jgi:hypothetical protein